MFAVGFSPLFFGLEVEALGAGDSGLGAGVVLGGSAGAGPTLFQMRSMISSEALGQHRRPSEVALLAPTAWSSLKPRSLSFKKQSKYCSTIPTGAN